MPSLKPTERERFEAKVRKSADCWEWAGYRNKQGYGVFMRTGKRSPDKAHRVAWQLYVGEIPSGMLVLHHCDNPRCVRVGHLYVGDQRQNVRDSVVRGRHRVGKPFKPGQFRGEANGRAKLTNIQALDVRRRALSGEKRKTIADDYGISLSMVTFIKKGANWAGDCLHDH